MHWIIALHSQFRAIHYHSRATWVGQHQISTGGVWRGRQSSLQIGLLLEGLVGADPWAQGISLFSVWPMACRKASKGLTVVVWRGGTSPNSPHLAVRMLLPAASAHSDATATLRVTLISLFHSCAPGVAHYHKQTPL